MLIAVPYENENVYPHFGKAPAFALFPVEHGLLSGMRIVSPAGSGHALLSEFLKEKKVDIVLCGGIGEPAKKLLNDASIRVIPGVRGNAIRAVGAFLGGILEEGDDDGCHDDSCDGTKCGGCCGGH